MRKRKIVNADFGVFGAKEPKVLEPVTKSISDKISYYGFLSLEWGLKLFVMFASALLINHAYVEHNCLSAIADVVIGCYAIYNCKKWFTGVFD